MPVYRSFVTCDDPKGVVECRTSRKSKSNARGLEDSVESGRKNLDSSSSDKQEGNDMATKKLAEDPHNNNNAASFQLLEVSRGAQKLNQVIDSWSNGGTFERNSKEIAKDILKGALDLQESLTMLGKLQQASQYIAKLKKNRKEKSRGERIDEGELQRSKSYHVADHRYEMGFQSSRLSEVGTGRSNSHHFRDHNNEMGFDNRRLSYEMEFENRRLSEAGIGRCHSHHLADHSYEMGFPEMRLSEIGIGRSHSHRFTDHSYEMGFQKPKLSSDRASRDSFEVLRTAISDGLARQNILPPSCNGKKASSVRKTWRSAPDIASTSSSQSSTVKFYDLTSSDSSLSSEAPGKLKGSNLIAKLMGLEESPSQEVHSAVQCEKRSEKISSPRRPLFDIDVPKARKPQSAAYKGGTEQRKLKEIVKTMQFKGLLKSMSAEELGLPSHSTDASDSKNRLTEDSPPIVIIKPMQFPSVEEKKPQLQKLLKGELLRNLKTKDQQSQRMNLGEVLTSNFKDAGRRCKGEETPTKSQQGTNKSKEVPAKAKETVVMAIDKPRSDKLKASVSVSQQQKKKVVEKKVDSIEKEAPRRRKPMEPGKAKSIVVAKSRDQAKVTTERKPDTGSIITKRQVSQKKSTSKGIISKHTAPALSRNCGDPKKNSNNEEPIKESLADNVVVEKVEFNYADKLVDSSENEPIATSTSTTTADEPETKVDSSENEPNTTSTSATTADEPETKEVIDTSEIQIKEQFDSNQNSLWHDILEITEHESYIKSAEEASCCFSDDGTEKKCFSAETSAKDLFFSSPSYLSYATELFDVNTNQAIVLQTTSLDDLFGIPDTRLLLDYANELMQHKSLRCAQSKHPLLLTPSRSLKTSSVPLIQMAQEVCGGIENLRSYTKHADVTLPTDSVYAVVERDLKSKGILGGQWDLGWRHAFTVDEVDQVVSEIENLVISGLIEGIVYRFCS